MQLHTSKHLFERASSNTPPPFRMRSCRTIHLRALRCGPGDTDAAPLTARCPCQPPQRTANRLLLLKIDQFVTAITAKARHSVYMCRLPRNGGDPCLRSYFPLSLLLLSRLVRSPSQVQETISLAHLPCPRFRCSTRGVSSPTCHDASSLGAL